MSGLSVSSCCLLPRASVSLLNTDSNPRVREVIAITHTRHMACSSHILVSLLEEEIFLYFQSTVLKIC